MGVMDEQNSFQSVPAGTKRIALYGLAALVLIAIAFTLILSRGPEEITYEPSVEYVAEPLPVATSEGVTVTTVQDEVPEGLPEDIYIEKGAVIEGLKAEFMQAGIKQISFNHLTKLTKEQVMFNYFQYMTVKGYLFRKGGDNRAGGSLYGDLGNDSLLVTVSPEGEENRVSVTFLDRK
jgi:hypothetical protein